MSKTKTQNLSQQIDKKIIQISQNFKQLKLSQTNQQKKIILEKLNKLSNQCLFILEKQNPSSNNARKKRQVQDIVKKCKQISDGIAKEEEKILEKEKKRKKEQEYAKGNINRQSGLYENYDQKISRISMQFARSIIQKQLTTKQLKYSSSQLDQIAKRLQTNHQVMKQIQLMVLEQGENIDLNQQNLLKAYQNVNQANTQLEEASRLQMKTRMMKIKLGLTGFLGGLGYMIFGLPGMMAGLVGGMFKIFK